MDDTIKGLCWACQSDVTMQLRFCRDIELSIYPKGPSEHRLYYICPNCSHWTAVPAPATDCHHSAKQEA